MDFELEQTSRNVDSAWNVAGSELGRLAYVDHEPYSGVQALASISTIWRRASDTRTWALDIGLLKILVDTYISNI